MRKRPCVAYLLWSASTGRVYAGQTCDPVRRLREHNGESVFKGARYTVCGRPWTMPIAFQCDNRSESVRVELALKRMCRADKLKMMGVSEPQLT